VRKGCTLTQPKQGQFYVSVGVLGSSLLVEAAALLHKLPWERHSLTAFAKPGVGGKDTPAPKRRALLLECEPERQSGCPSWMNTATDGVSGARGATDRLSSPELGSPMPPSSFTYQPHRSGGLSSRPNMSMTTAACADLGPQGATAQALMDRLCRHNASLGFVEKGLACVTTDDVSASNDGKATCARSIRNIGEGLAYCGGEELKWHHDGNQIHRWLEQRDVLSSFILRCDNAAKLTPSRNGPTYITSGEMPPTLAIKPHDDMWPQVRLHPPVGSKLDLVATGAIAEHARKPLSKSRKGESLLVFVGRRMVPPREHMCSGFAVFSP
jgi:hypothetical protein